MIVVKVGGGTSLNIDAVVADIVSLRAKGTELLLVHGGAQTTNQVAETLGGVDWQPARMDFGETLARLIAEIPAAMRGSTAVETVLRKSDELADLEAVAQSWFEDGPDIARAIAGARARNRAKVVTYLLQSVIARHRDKWADLLLRTALWMREAPLELDLCWRELAIVAKALADGRDMAEIGLMRDIAQRTLAVLANDERM